MSIYDPFLINLAFSCWKLLLLISDWPSENRNKIFFKFLKDGNLYYNVLRILFI